MSIKASDLIKSLQEEIDKNGDQIVELHTERSIGLEPYLGYDVQEDRQGNKVITGFLIKSACWYPDIARSLRREREKKQKED